MFDVLRWISRFLAVPLLPSHPRRYKNLLARPTILRELTAERETLLAQLTALLDSMDGEYVWRVAKGACVRVCSCACLRARACVCLCVLARVCGLVDCRDGPSVFVEGGEGYAESLGWYACGVPAVSP